MVGTLIKSLLSGAAFVAGGVGSYYVIKNHKEVKKTVTEQSKKLRFAVVEALDPEKEVRSKPRRVA